jgi:hypothetical protein
MKNSSKCPALSHGQVILIVRRGEVLFRKGK